jgi:GNAT superfamily N-acetyltransferase
VSAAVESGACHVAIFHGEIAGLVILNYSFFGFGFIALLITRERFLRKGIASALIHFIEGTCTTERIFTSTERSNGPMQMLLDQLGYARSGVVENLEEGGEPELIYSRKLRTRAPL